MKPIDRAERLSALFFFRRSFRGGFHHFVHEFLEVIEAGRGNDDRVPPAADVFGFGGFELETGAAVTMDHMVIANNSATQGGATSSTASTIGRYPVQRHMLPDIPTTTSSLVGWRFESKSALALMIIPDVQKPH